MANLLSFLVESPCINLLVRNYRVSAIVTKVDSMVTRVVSIVTRIVAMVTSVKVFKTIPHLNDPPAQCTVVSA